jgi:hypothetical protein
MCEFTSRKSKKDAYRFFRNNGFRINVPISVLKSRFPYAFQPEQCPVCGCRLSAREMRPPGRATRCMCIYDYEQLIASSINESCFICGRPLPSRKIEKQLENPREIEHHMDDQDCRHLWTLLHNVVLNEFGIPSPRELTFQHRDRITQDRLLESPSNYKGRPIINLR